MSNEAVITGGLITAGYSYKRPSFYRRHRNLINVGIASGIGVITGGLIGGNRRGIGYGAAAGAGAGYALHLCYQAKKTPLLISVN